MHDGLFGRSHIYSYTKDNKGVWWKIVDYQVSEVKPSDPRCSFSTVTFIFQVTEDMVLNDHTGLHLGAGPLLLFYSRANSIDPGLENPPVFCPRFVKVRIKISSSTSMFNAYTFRILFSRTTSHSSQNLK